MGISRWGTAGLQSGWRAARRQHGGALDSHRRGRPEL